MSEYVAKVVTVTDALSKVTTLGYDANGNRTSLEDASGNTTTFAYDKLDRLTGETDPLGKALAYAYDDAGNLTVAHRIVVAFVAEFAL